MIISDKKEVIMQKKANKIQKLFRISEQTMTDWEGIVEYYKKKHGIDELNENYVFKRMLKDFLSYITTEQKTA